MKTLAKRNKLIILISIFVLIIVISATLFFCVFYPLKYKYSIVKYCNEFNLEYDLVSALINVESGFDKDIVSSAGAVGLMQVMPATAQEVAFKLNIDYSETLLTEVDSNIRLGCYYLRYLLDMYGNNLKLALCAYNAGFNKVNLWLQDSRYSEDGMNLKYIPIDETRDYVYKITKSMRVYALYF